MLSNQYPNMGLEFDKNLSQPTEQFISNLHTLIHEGKGWVGSLENEVDLIILFTAHYILTKKEKILSSHFTTLVYLNDQPIEFSKQEVTILLRALLYQNGKADYSRYLNIVRQKCPSDVGNATMNLTVYFF